MIELAQPWMLVLLPLPLLAWWLLPAARSGNAAAIRLPFHRRFETLSAGTGGQIRRSGSIIALKSLAWCLLVLAAALEAASKASSRLFASARISGEGVGGW